jgi:hypothetical protein
MDTDKEFLTRTPIALEIRARINKWYCTVLKGFYTSKEIIMSDEIAHRMGENIFQLLI